MGTLTLAEANAEIARRLAATKIKMQAKGLSRGQRFMLHTIAKYHPGGFSPCGDMQSKTVDILFQRFGYLDRQKVARRETVAGVVPAYWLYTANDAGMAALEALGIQVTAAPARVL